MKDKGSGPYGLETIRDLFADAHDSVVMLIFDVWKEKDSKERTQVRLPYMKIEEVVDKYGDFVYSGWYTEGWINNRYKASMWASADAEHRVDWQLYEHWPELWKEEEK